ncbi:hypothetical protein CAC42_4050 [Sphaceloma murrayae]|uniref:DUF1365-domain-containing protein n=1 Tax=Sphaceloma murrayae TaxID=2082308 RepID=A0A2K1QSS0_9PEZI|nr:hypothetical protein CAC42_4050 [Sphaceloma murrayae]
MRTRSGRIRDSAIGWLGYGIITYSGLMPVMAFAASLWTERQQYAPLLQYGNPIWLGTIIMTLFWSSLLGLIPQLFLNVIATPDFAGYYIFRWLGFSPQNLPIPWAQWNPIIITVIMLRVMLQFMPASPPQASDHGPSNTVETSGAADSNEGSAPITTVKEARMEKFLMPPLLFPAKTTHTRFFPKKHSFAYSYFYVGIPVGWQGRSGTALSADVEQLPVSRRKYGWFDVNSADYLMRSSKHPSLESKLRTYLRGEGVKDDEWSFAYLCTAPRFLGYSFNPVSFWYIYGQKSELKMMLLEVNNTFDERRMYLLRADEVTAEGEAQAKFKKTWTKDFHVSPFNSRKGSYSLQASNPHTPGRMLETAFDNLITLKSSKNEIKLVARVFSEGPAIDPSSVGDWQMLQLIASWFWVGFMTFPRIIYEASMLFFARKLHVWYRPEIMPSSLGRHATAEEKTLEKFFCQYLKFLIERSASSVEVVYHPPGDVGDVQVFSTPHSVAQEDEKQLLEVTVLSPAFYSRLIHYAHLTEAFDREGLCTDEKNRTVVLSRPDVLDMLLKEDSTRPSIGKRCSRLETWRWDMLCKYRCPPPPVSYVEDGAKPVRDVVVEDIRPERLSQLDRFAMERTPADEAAWYRTTVTKTFVTQRYALGISALVGLAEYLLQVALSVAAYRATTAAFAAIEAASIAFAGGDVVLAHGKLELLMAVSGSLAGAGLVHLWNVAKGT